MKTKFTKVTDRKGTSIFEGEEKPGKVFNISRFICDVGPQQTEKETQEVADLIVNALNDYSPK
ncbi:MAG: hypothetical protein Q8O62_10010 [Aequorivita sp.]|nr:hypothetical protein [Aequorivita sp.]